MKISSITALILAIFLPALLPGCALTKANHDAMVPETIALYLPQASAPEEQLLQRYAPCFKVEGYQHDYNRIGAPALRMERSGEPEIFIDISRPTIYGLVQPFTTARGSYTNLIYRVHFPAIPERHLTFGRNVGLLVYVTLNDHLEPVLITTLHTCGCYLAMVPTTNLAPVNWPAGHTPDRQEVFGEYLPGELSLPARIPSGRLVITLRGETHRVMDLQFAADPEASQQAFLDPPINLAPMALLQKVSSGDGYVSFFEEVGDRKGYVKGSQKPWERLLMGWWALDFRVGEDKALGSPEETGVTLYTSLKFWARRDSNIWDFPNFLKYWGWML